MVTLGLATWIIGPAVGLFVLVSVVLILMILIQKPQGGGLGGAFGASSGSGQTAFGAKTGDVLTITTVSIFALWLLFAIGLNFAVRPQSAASQNAVMGSTTPEDAPVDTGASGEGTAGDESGASDDAADQPAEGGPSDDGSGAGDDGGDPDGSGDGSGNESGGGSGDGSGGGDDSQGG